MSISLLDEDPCNETYVQVLNGGLASSPSLGRFCRMTNRIITSTSNRLRVVYHSRSNVARTNRVRIMFQRVTPGMYRPTAAPRRVAVFRIKADRPLTRATR